MFYHRYIITFLKLSKMNPSMDKWTFSAIRRKQSTQVKVNSFVEAFDP